MNASINHRSPLSKFLCSAAARLVLAGAVAPALAADGVAITADARSPAAYRESLRQSLENGMRVASTKANAATPDGIVAMWFVLSDDGRLIARGVEQSSGSPVLDREAGRIVSHTRYAAMPDAAWNRGADQRYIATMHFGLDGIDDRASLDVQ